MIIKKIIIKILFSVLRFLFRNLCDQGSHKTHVMRVSFRQFITKLES